MSGDLVTFFFLWLGRCSNAQRRRDYFLTNERKLIFLFCFNFQFAERKRVHGCACTAELFTVDDTSPVMLCSIMKKILCTACASIARICRFTGKSTCKQQLKFCHNSHVKVYSSSIIRRRSNRSPCIINRINRGELFANTFC